MNLIATIEAGQLKAELPEIRPGDTVRVHLRIREGSKERVQVFEGLVIRRRGGAGLRASITVRRIASGVGTERVFLLHSPQIVRIQVTRRTRVRRALLSYMRGRRGKAARLTERRFDRIDMSMERTEDSGQKKDEPEVPGSDSDTPSSDDLSSEEATEVSSEGASDTEPERADTVSTEELAAEEDKAAADSADDPNPDENETPEEEVESGLDQAGRSTDATSPAQKTDKTE